MYTLYVRMHKLYIYIYKFWRQQDFEHFFVKKTFDRIVNIIKNNFVAIESNAIITPRP